MNFGADFSEAAGELHALPRETLVKLLARQFEWDIRHEKWFKPDLTFQTSRPLSEDTNCLDFEGFFVIDGEGDYTEITICLMFIVYFTHCQGVIFRGFFLNGKHIADYILHSEEPTGGPRPSYRYPLPGMADHAFRYADIAIVDTEKHRAMLNVNRINPEWGMRGSDPFRLSRL